MAHGTGSVRTRPGSIWLREPRTTRRRGAIRGHRAPLDLEQVTAAAVRLLDADGLDAFSMRRLAGELGVTAMSVYWYVECKEDLLELALDAAFEAPEEDPPGEEAAPPAAWREQLTRLAHASAVRYTAHPWVPTLLARHPDIGPRATALRRRVCDTVREAGLSPEQAEAATRALLSFVHGYGPASPGVHPAPPQPLAPPAEFDAALAFLLTGVETLAARAPAGEHAPGAPPEPTATAREGARSGALAGRG
ncbi:TetR/AcrR family transcriptional regulator [Streptomyces sulphureus]|uniref:TetR/AcrR family transcriptional regulator n=1 Tax=Streptomyces sulphureus TaxID=47758 RepID=UPI000369F6A5|nr:TetR/AcrR family transcriptional regulator [Streptomyces sulphureus]